MTLQAWHTCIWRVSSILLCRSSQALSGWMVSVAAQLISGFSRDVRSGSSPGSGWATQGHSETCSEATRAFFFGCVLRGVVPGEGRRPPQAEVLSSLVFNKDLSLLWGSWMGDLQMGYVQVQWSVSCSDSWYLKLVREIWVSSFSDRCISHHDRCTSHRDRCISHCDRCTVPVKSLGTPTHCTIIVKTSKLWNNTYGIM